MSFPMYLLTEDEKQNYPKYLEQAKACGGPPGMAAARDINSGTAIIPADFMLKPKQENAYSEKIDAVYKSKQK